MTEENICKQVLAMLEITLKRHRSRKAVADRNETKGTE